MKPKIGRPKVKKSKLRAILIQARVSEDENRVIQTALERSKSAKSDWIRQALLRAAEIQEAA